MISLANVSYATTVRDLVAAPFVLLTLPLFGELLIVCSGNLLPARRTRPTADDGGKLYIVVPAHNEALSIRNCVQSLKTCCDDRGTILVVAHNCNDATASIAAEAGATVLALNDPDRAGKGHALTAGYVAALASGAGIIMTFDADSTSTPSLISATRAAFSQGAEATQCRYEMARSGLAGVAFRAMNHVRARGRSGWGLSCGIFGNGFTVRASVFQRVPYQALSIAEDLEYHLTLVRCGVRVTYVPQATVLGEPAANGTGTREQRARWEGGRLNLARSTTRALFREIGQGNRRLIEPLLDLWCLPLAYAGVTIVVLALLLKSYGLALLFLLCFYVGVAIGTGENPRQDLLQLLKLPAYILWKLRLTSQVISRSDAKATWVRTERLQPHELPATPDEDRP